MKLVDRKTFLNLPDNTIYSLSSNYSGFEGLYIKTKTLDNDWIFQDLIESIDLKEHTTHMDRWYEIEEGDSFKLDYDSGQRDGCFDDKCMFVIWDKSDINRLLVQLNRMVKHAEYATNGGKRTKTEPKKDN